MDSPSSVQILFGASPNEDIKHILKRITALPAWYPFDERVIRFVAEWSRRVLTSPYLREFPEVTALGYWFRTAHLREMSRAQTNHIAGHIQIGRGLAFHLAPSNVDSIFMYSCLISLLAGNINLVRVSQKQAKQQDFLMRTLMESAQEPDATEVAERLLILTYPHNEQITAEISEACMVRVVWGGDATIRAIRSIPLRPTATEICFADRFSLAAFSSIAVKTADTNAFRDLIRGFYNDAFWFAQQACSSPRMIVWVGTEPDTAEAKQRFWSALSKEVVRRHAENTPTTAMARLVASYEYAAHGLAKLSADDLWNHFPSRMEGTTSRWDDMREFHCGNGFFIQVQVPFLTGLASQLTDKYQTLVVYGFSEQDKRDLINSLGPRSLDRIVSVGKALAFDPVWDGQNLIRSLTRIIVCS